MGISQPRPVLLAGALIVAGSDVLASPPEVRPRDNYVGVIVGSDADKPELAFYSGVHEVNGRLAICGLVVIDTNDNSLKRAEKQIARQIRYRLGNEDLIVQTASFKRYSSEADARAGTAGCSVLKRPWNPAYAALPYEMIGGPVRYTDQ